MTNSKNYTSKNNSRNNSQLEIIMNAYTKHLILWGNIIPIIQEHQMRTPPCKDGHDTLYIDFDNFYGLHNAQTFFHKVIRQTKTHKDLEVNLYATNPETYKPGVSIKMPTPKYILRVVEQSNDDIIE